MVPFSTLGYRRGIARVSPEYVSCVALSCVVAAAAAATAAGSACLAAGLAAAVVAAYLPTTELRAPQGVATTLGGLSVCSASVFAPVSLCIFGWSLHFDCSRGETCVPLRFSTK